LASELDVKGQIKTFLLEEVIVKDVKSNGSIEVSRGESDDEFSEIIPPLYYAGSGDHGTFVTPKRGTRLLVARVHPGSRGVTQAIKVLAKPNEELDSTELNQSADVPAGTSGSPIRNLNDGEIKIISGAGGEIHLLGEPPNSYSFFGDASKGGLYLYSSGADTRLTTVSHTTQIVSAGSRLVSGNIVRIGKSSGLSSVSSVVCGHELPVVTMGETGNKVGIWPGYKGFGLSIGSTKRNPCLSEHRLVINEISEDEIYTGWDLEYGIASKSSPGSFGSEHIKAIRPNNALHLAPHQLIEVIGGNVANRRGEVLDINYGVIRLGDANGAPIVSETEYERARLKSRRGIGYHFQLSTNSKSSEYSNSKDNFIFSLDKEGSLKVNIPKTSNTGNVSYPTGADFHHGSGGVKSIPSVNIEPFEKIPVTLRDSDKNAILPTETTNIDMAMSVDGIQRSTGVRHLNDNRYFRNLNSESDGSVRVHTTKYHNMYAAAEMLIANTIKKINIPPTNTDADGVQVGNPVLKYFERPIADLNLVANEDPNTIKYMTTVSVSPSRPAIDPGGNVVVAGVDRASTVEGSGEEKVTFFSPYANSFNISKGSGSDFSTTNVGDSGKGLDPGGKSANLNFEGSIEASVGSDNNDQKSMVLDMAGSLIAWFGMDKVGRSMVLQTDGAVAISVGGHNQDTFNTGRFDLRVNVTDKGFLGEDEETEIASGASDYIISISDAGLVIAGSNPGAPMVIRNAGPLMLESSEGNLTLSAAGQVKIREGGRPERPTYMDPASMDTPGASSTPDDEGNTPINDAFDGIAKVLSGPSPRAGEVA